MEESSLGYLDKPTSHLLDDFGAGKASPGSGSAAALMGLLACKLIRTVCIKSVEKKPALKSKFELVMSEMAGIEKELAQIFEKDAADFAEVVELRQRRERAENSNEAGAFQRQSNDLLEQSTDRLFTLANLCLKAVEFGISVFEEGWEPIRGDSGAAISVAISGAMSCVFIVNVNAKTLKNRSSSKVMVQLGQDLTSRIQASQNKAFECVVNISREALTAIEDVDLLALLSESEGASVSSTADSK